MTKPSPKPEVRNNSPVTSNVATEKDASIMNKTNVTNETKLTRLSPVTEGDDMFDSQTDRDGGGPDATVAPSAFDPARIQARYPIDSAAVGPTKPNPFDPARLRISQDYRGQTSIQKVLTSVPVRKPDRQWLVGPHPPPKRPGGADGLLLKAERGER